MANSYVFTPMDEQLIYSTIPERISKFAEETPDKVAFICYSEDFTRKHLTCSELYQKSKVFSKGLVKIGIKPGDIVGIGLPNTVEYLICHIGVMMAGAISLGLTFARKDGLDLIHSIKTAGNCVALIFDSGDGNNKFNILKQFIARTDNFGKILNQQIQGLKLAIPCGSETLAEFPLTFESVLQLGVEDVLLPALDPDDTCMILLTSGTTGYSKLVPKTHLEMINMYKSMNDRGDVQQNDIFFNPAPFTWIGGYIANYLLVGCTCVTMENMLSVGNLEMVVQIFIKIIKIAKCNAALLIAPALYVMVDSKVELGPNFPMKSVVVGGYPMKKSIAAVIGRVTTRLVYVYAGTEFNIITTKLIVDKSNFTDYNCGVPVPGFEAKIVDSAGNTCPRKEIGTIYIRSRWRFQGFLGNQEQTKKVLKASGWLNTDDKGYLTENGEIISLGRQSDLITVSSALVSPYEVESFIARHPEVKAVVVVPVPDLRTFQQMCACIIRETGSQVSWETIGEFLRSEMIAKQGTIEMVGFFPKYHVFLNSFPTTPTGKVKKHALIANVIEILQLK